MFVIIFFVTLLTNFVGLYADGIWTDGINNIVAASFDWRTDKSRVSESLRIVQGVHHGLVMYKGRSGALRERGMGATVGYVCYMHMAKTGQPTVMDYQIGFEEFDTAEANNDTISASKYMSIVANLVVIYSVTLTCP